ncbi:MAG: small ribosomal subunit Rsm22 family protein [Rhabdochlamydiaceae bacterium]|nr:small ribosomal subunit Rsm22 family protein [Rhabdochlamydiaceae bacterium]
MTKRPPTPKPLWEELFPILIPRYRKLMKLPIGPLDTLQTREFRSLVEHVVQYKDTQEISSTELLAAYFMYEWPIQYAQGLSLIQELPQKPSKVLDLTSKGAPICLAALQHGATEVLAIGENEQALKMSADICGHLGYPISIRVGNREKLNSLSIHDMSWDLIIVSHSLFDLFPSTEEHLSYLKKLLHLLSPDGYLLFVEDSENRTNRRFLQLRDAIAEQGISIVAPCLWKGECPALKHGSSPCFAQRPFEKPFMIKEIQRAAQINLSSLKMSYLILGSLKVTRPPLPDTLYRVVSPPLPTFRGERYFLCGVQGKKTLGTTLKEHPKHSRAFDYVKRGDVLSIEQAVSLGEDMQITEKTIVELKAPCDKPVLI